MSQTNIQIVRHFIEALDDLSVIDTMLSSDFLWQSSEGCMNRAEYKAALTEPLSPGVSEETVLTDIREVGGNWVFASATTMSRGSDAMGRYRTIKATSNAYYRVLNSKIVEARSDSSRLEEWENGHWTLVEPNT